MSVVNGLVLDASGNPRSTHVRFTPKTTPLFESPGIITKTVRTLQAAVIDGSFSITLLQGIYTVRIGDSDEFQITVPNDTDTYEISELVTSGGFWSQDPSPPSGAITNAFQYLLGVDANQALTGAYAAAGTLSLILVAGNHLVRAIAAVNGLSPDGSAEDFYPFEFKLRNTTTAADVAGAYAKVTNIYSGSRGLVTVEGIVATAGCTVSLQGKAGAVGQGELVLTESHICSVRLT